MTHVLGELAVAASSSIALALIVKATVVLSAALVAVRLAHAARASVRHLVLANAFLALLVLPVLSAVAPARDVAVPVSSTVLASGVATFEAPAPAASSEPVRGDVSLGGRLFMVLSASTLLVAIWLVGAAVLFVPMVGALMRVYCLRRDGLPLLDAAPILTEVARHDLIGRRVRLLMDARVEGPMTCGVLDPVIVLPMDARAWHPDDLRRALVHELEHVRRGDWMTLCLARAVCALYWFHPLVWMSWRQLRLEAERACDDAVLCHGLPEVYAEQLVTLAARVTSGGSPSVLAMASRGDLSARISALLDDRQSRGRAGARWFAAATVAAVLLLASIAPLRAVGLHQTGSTNDASRNQEPTFDAVVLRRNTSGASGMEVDQQGNRYLMRNGDMRTLILNAFGPRNTELIGAPSWIKSDRYDMTATFDPSATREQVRSMLRTFLADRLKLAAHYEDRDQDVYVLSVARADGRLGPSIRPSPGDCAGVAAARAAGQPTPPVPPAANGAPGCGMRSIGGEFLAGGITMDLLSRNLGSRVGRIVIDRTGLTGYYELTLKFSADTAASPDATGDRPSIFTALREQLGLNLDSGRAPIQTLVVDHVERPSDDQN